MWSWRCKYTVHDAFLSVTMSSCQSGYSDTIARLKYRIFDLAETKQVYLHPVSYINLLPSSQPTRHCQAANPPSNYCHPSNQVIQQPTYKGRSVWTSAGILKKLGENRFNKIHTPIRIRAVFQRFASTDAKHYVFCVSDTKNA